MIKIKNIFAKHKEKNALSQQRDQAVTTFNPVIEVNINSGTTRHLYALYDAMWKILSIFDKLFNYKSNQIFKPYSLGTYKEQKNKYHKENNHINPEYGSIKLLWSQQINAMKTKGEEADQKWELFQVKKDYKILYLYICNIYKIYICKYIITCNCNA